jgi:hypothetical protein
MYTLEAHLPLRTCVAGVAVDFFDWCKLLNTISSFRNLIHTGKKIQ